MNIKLSVKRLAYTVLTAAAALSMASGVAVAAIDGGYVGTTVCAGCHTTQAADFSKTGHPYKVRFTNGDMPTISDPLSFKLLGKTPLLSALTTSTNNALMIDDGTGRLAWSAVEYVIGGYGWKARWGIRDASNLDGDGVNDTGYIWTGSGAQFNMLDGSYGGYNAGTDKKYSCAICHNTNGTSSVDSGCTTTLGSGRTEPWAATGLTTASPGGFRSEWTYSGVQCEACHGPGEGHVGTTGNPYPVLNIAGDDICAKCHIRSTNTTGFGGECGGDAGAAILTNGALNNDDGTGALSKQYVQHHEQYNELVGYNDDGAHYNLSCVQCHNPHKRAHKVTADVASALSITDNDTSAQARGAVVSCESCHGAQASGPRIPMGNITCVDCHMAEITKSATAKTGTWGAKGDVKGHIFAIDALATTMSRTNTDGKYIATNVMTVNFACGKCHDKDVSTAGSPMTVEQAQFFAKNMHGPAMDQTNHHDGTCKNCHDAGVTLTTANDSCMTCHNSVQGSNQPVSMSTLNHLTGWSTTPNKCVDCHTEPGVGVSLSSVGAQNLLVVCGSCHGGGTGPAPANYSGKGPYKTLDILKAIANGIHRNKTAPKADTVELSYSADGKTVSFFDNFLYLNDMEGLKITVNWGDGSVETKEACEVFSHTYSRSKTYNISYSMYNGVLSDSKTFKATVPVTYSISGIARIDGVGTSGVTLVLKQKGHTKKVLKSSANGAFSFTKVKPGVYDILAYKYHVNFAKPVVDDLVVDGTKTDVMIDGSAW